MQAARWYDPRNVATRLSSSLVSLLLLLNLEQECAVDVRQNTTEGNRGVNESIKFLVASDGERRSGIPALL
jgi:hypothetical protein